jgi:chaperone required for assembly of F1-ATPase
VIIKRFYKRLGLKPSEYSSKWLLVLDGKPVYTPARSLFEIPTLQIAEKILQEWDVTEGSELILDAMPLTRFVNTVIDRIHPDYEQIMAQTLAYAGMDLLYYRASEPQDLVSRQDTLWNPVVSWIESTLDLKFKIATGIIPVDQEENVLEKFAVFLASLTYEELASVNILCSLSGSLLLTFCLYKGYLTPDTLWTLVHLDEIWHTEKWGEDEEATKRLIHRRLEFDQAVMFLELVHQHEYLQEYH